MELQATKDKNLKFQEVRIRPPNLLLISDLWLRHFSATEPIHSATELTVWATRF